MSATAVLAIIPALITAALMSAGETRDHAQKRSWNELAREVQSYWTLRIVLADGTIVEGRSAQFAGEGLKMQVEKSSQKTLHPRGSIFIPREQVKVLNIRTNRPVGRAVDRHFEHVEVTP